MAQDFEIEIREGKKTLIKYHGDDQEVVIPGGIEIIGPEAFTGNKIITSVIVPCGVRQILNEDRYGFGAFKDCSNLQFVNLPKSLENIGNSTFDDCTSLVSVTIPESVKEIGRSAFSGCSSLKSVILPEGLKEINEHVFSSCSSLINISIPRSVTRIKDCAFGWCSSLYRIKIPGNVKTIESSFSNLGGVFADCTSLTSVEIMNGVEVIGGGAFRNCTSLKSIVIPVSVKTLDDGNTFYGVFQGCTNLVTVEMKNGVSEIGGSAFKDCTSLSSVILPHSVRSIGQHAFFGCSKLVSLSLPEGLERIDTNAFAGCDRLRSITLPRSIQKVAGDAFDDCDTPIELCVYYLHDNATRGEFLGLPGKYFTLLAENGKKVGKLFQLSAGVFKDFMNKLISGNVEHLSEYDDLFFTTSDLMIRKCRAALCRLEYPLELNDNYRGMYVNSLQNYAEYILPSLIKSGNVASISTLAAIDAIPLESLETFIEETNKQRATEITAVLLDYKNKRRGQSAISDLTLDVDTPPKEWLTRIDLDGECVITKYQGDSEIVRIPAMIDGQKVKRISGQLGSLKVSIFFPYMDKVHSVEIEDGIEVIDERAFLDCRNLKSVVIPESVKDIAAEAFCGCSDLKSISIPKSVKWIGEGAFLNCSSLGIVSIPEGVERISSSTFYDCVRLTSIKIPQGVKRINGFSFYNCNALTSISFPESLREIDGHAFAGCVNLTSVDIPNSVGRIGEYAFRGCLRLRSVIIPESVNDISSSAFEGCSSLISCIIPKGITEIGWSVFEGCENLSSVHIPGSVKVIEERAFEGCPSLRIHAPSGSYAIQYAKENHIRYIET